MNPKKKKADTDTDTDRTVADDVDLGGVVEGVAGLVVDDGGGVAA